MTNAETSPWRATPPDPTARPAPIRAPDRIETLDILRGLAVLGILAVNAAAFAWPATMDAGSDLALFSVEGGNRIAAWITDVFLANKFRTLFSMLFGISIFLVGGERSDGTRGRLLRRRLMLLGLFGLMHGLAVWFGDILLLYAWSGLFMMLARSWTPGKLMLTGLALMTAFAVLSVLGESASAFLAPERDAESYAAFVREGQAVHQAEVDRMRSGFGAAMFENLKMWAIVQGVSLTLLVFPTAGLMMVGLSLFKTGFLAGRSSSLRYALVLLAGLCAAAALGVAQWRTMAPGPSPGLLVLTNAVLGQLAPLVTLAWVALLVLMTRNGLGALTRRLAPVGRMAFTNYLTQSLIMASLFYMPWGPRLYGQVEPAGLWAIVLGVWALQLVWSPLWLSRFEMGPLEWVWRCLTYGRRFPFVKTA